MERSRASKKKFQMRSPFKGSITDFMTMGKILGSSKLSPSTTVDFGKHYKSPSKKGEKKEESASKILKNKKAQIELDKMSNTQTLEDLNITGKIDYTPSKIKSLKLDED